MVSTVTDRIAALTGTLGTKAPCVVATTANITLSGEQTIDGVLTDNTRVLVKNQTTASQNGIYTSSTGTWVREPDFDGDRDVLQGTLVPVGSGTLQAGTVWRLTSANPITIGTSDITFTDNFPFEDLTYDTVTAMKAAGDPGVVRTAFVRGGTSVGDGNGGTYSWNTTSTETADDKWIVQATSVTTGRWRALSLEAATGRNHVANGLFNFARTSAAVALTTTPAIATVDDWYVFQNTTAEGISRQVDSGTAGLYKELKIGRNSASTTTGAIIAIHALRTKNSVPLAGKKVVLSVSLRAGADFSGSNVNVYLASSTAENEAAGSIGIWTGVATVASATQTITTTGTRYQFTGTVPSGCKQLGVRFYYTPSGTAGADDNLYIGKVKLEEGLAATDFDPILERVESASLRQPQITCGRLSNMLTATAPNPMEDPFDTCHFLPFNGNQILVNGHVEIIPHGQFALNGGIVARYSDCYVDKVPGQTLADATLYGVYVFMNNGVPTLTFSDFSTGYYNQNGADWGNAVHVNDPTQTFIGIARIKYVGGVPTTYGGARGQTIAGYFNQFRANLLTAVAGSTSNNTDTQLPDGGTLVNGQPENNFLEWVQFYDQAPLVEAIANCSNTTATNGVVLGIGSNSRTVISGLKGVGVSAIASGSADVVNVSAQAAPSDYTGYRYAQALGYEVERAGAGTAYFNGYLIARGVML